MLKHEKGDTEHKKPTKPVFVKKIVGAAAGI
jgi:hypothetical protein